ncbi:TIGR01777 family oxidoreductase [Alcaligenaceae bacterium A4P071]|nr:TIGR01777 family oxidoreductase [Alcaligenaceae bacterium A4P071]
MTEHTGRRVLITGGTGFIGKALVKRLLAAGDRITVLTRRPRQASTSLGGAVRCIETLARLSADDGFDVVVNLAGAPVVGPPWSKRRKSVLMHSRVGTTRALIEWLGRTAQKPAVWVQASAIGVYGVRDPEEVLSEDSAVGNGFMSELCVAWEAAARAAVPLGVRQVVLRFSLVFGPGGSLPFMLMPYRLGLGGRLGSGRQMLSWVHLDDVLAVIGRAIDQPEMTGVYNMVAPQPVHQSDFAATAGRVLNRPTWLSLPAAPLRMLAGEMGQLFLDGQRVMPTRLQREGYAFKHPTLEGTLRDLT